MVAIQVAEGSAYAIGDVVLSGVPADLEKEARDALAFANGATLSAGGRRRERGQARGAPAAGRIPRGECRDRDPRRPRGRARRHDSARDLRASIDPARGRRRGRRCQEGGRRDRAHDRCASRSRRHPRDPPAALRPRRLPERRHPGPAGRIRRGATAWRSATRAARLGEDRSRRAAALPPSLWACRQRRGDRARRAGPAAWHRGRPGEPEPLRPWRDGRRSRCGCGGIRRWAASPWEPNGCSALPIRSTALRRAPAGAAQSRTARLPSRRTSRLSRPNRPTASAAPSSCGTATASSGTTRSSGTTVPIPSISPSRSPVSRPAVSSTAETTPSIRLAAGSPSSTARALEAHIGSDLSFLKDFAQYLALRPAGPRSGAGVGGPSRPGANVRRRSA